jgi:chromosome segregation protein
MAADPATVSSARSAEELRERLQAVSQELHKTQREIQQDAASLERLRQMLDLGYWNELVGIVNELENRVREANEMAAQADTLSGETRRKLEEEQRRLEKLWDAFKMQERELRAAEEKATRLERDLADKDAGKARLEADLEDKEADVRRTSEENAELLAKVEELERRLGQLKDLEELRSQAEDYRAKYESERDRLAKLFALFEESEAERERLQREVEAADQWFDENREALDKMSKSLRWRSSMLKKKNA